MFFAFKPAPDGTAKQASGVGRDISCFGKDAQGAGVRRDYEELGW